jgi:hypothetical protein
MRLEQTPHAAVVATDQAWPGRRRRGRRRDIVAQFQRLRLISMAASFGGFAAQFDFKLSGGVRRGVIVIDVCPAARGLGLEVGSGGGSGHAHLCLSWRIRPPHLRLSWPVVVVDMLLLKL